MRPFNAISAVVTQVQTAYASARRVFSLLDAKEDTADPACPEHIEDPLGDIVFDDVSFSYDKEHPLLQHISFHAAPGKQIALVGPTGCGKTTLINLLLRFYDIDSGAIFVDGNSTKNLTRSELRAQFGGQLALRPALGRVRRREPAAGAGAFGTQTDSGVATQRF